MSTVSWSTFHTSHSLGTIRWTGAQTDCMTTFQHCFRPYGPQLTIGFIRGIVRMRLEFNDLLTNVLSHALSGLFFFHHSVPSRHGFVNRIKSARENAPNCSWVVFPMTSVNANAIRDNPSFWVSANRLTPAVAASMIGLRRCGLLAHTCSTYWRMIWSSFILKWYQIKRWCQTESEWISWERGNRLVQNTLLLQTRCSRRTYTDSGASGNEVRPRFELAIDESGFDISATEIPNRQNWTNRRSRKL